MAICSDPDKWTYCKLNGHCVRHYSKALLSFVVEGASLVDEDAAHTFGRGMLRATRRRPLHLFAHAEDSATLRYLVPCLEVGHLASEAHQNGDATAPAVVAALCTAIEMIEEEDCNFFRFAAPDSPHISEECCLLLAALAYATATAFQ